jgi:thiol:disulfide interchange protein
MKKHLIVVLLSFMLFPAAAQKQQPRIYAFKFHADWCGTCKLMGPLFEELSGSALNKQDVLFYQFDFTDKSTQHQSRLMASALGVTGVLSTNTGTGFILLVDVQTKKVLDKITREDDLRAATAKVMAKLKAAQSL